MGDQKPNKIESIMIRGGPHITNLSISSYLPPMLPRWDIQWIVIFGGGCRYFSMLANRLSLRAHSSKHLPRGPVLLDPQIEDQASSPPQRRPDGGGVHTWTQPVWAGGEGRGYTPITITCFLSLSFRMAHWRKGERRGSLPPCNSSYYSRIHHLT